MEESHSTQGQSTARPTTRVSDVRNRGSFSHFISFPGDTWFLLYTPLPLACDFCSLYLQCAWDIAYGTLSILDYTFWLKFPSLPTKCWLLFKFWSKMVWSWLALGQLSSSDPNTCWGKGKARTCGTWDESFTVGQVLPKGLWARPIMTHSSCVPLVAIIVRGFVVFCLKLPPVGEPSYFKVASRKFT